MLDLINDGLRVRPVFGSDSGLTIIAGPLSLLETLASRFVLRLQVTDIFLDSLALRGDAANLGLYIFQLTVEESEDRITTTLEFIS